MNNILEVFNLKKEYDEKIVVDNISFSIQKGEIVGFVGPNGAGKTTTLKMLLGLVKPTSGKIHIDGIDISKDFEKVITNVGAIVETPAFYPYLSGYDNLLLSFRMYKKADIGQLKELIELVGLTKRINDPVKKYSLGMKQRLGVCRALIGNPKLLFLDEPINGLDPNGVIEFRNLITDISEKSNVSVLISSHILSEIEKICSKVIVIDRGKITSVIDMSDKADNQLLRIETYDVEKTTSVFSNMNRIKIVGNEINYVDISIEKDIVNNIIPILVKNNIQVQSVSKIDNSLEQNYIKLTKKQDGDCID